MICGQVKLHTILISVFITKVLLEYRHTIVHMLSMAFFVLWWQHWNRVRDSTARKPRTFTVPPFTETFAWIKGFGKKHQQLFSLPCISWRCPWLASVALSRFSIKPYPQSWEHKHQITVSLVIKNRRSVGQWLKIISCCPDRRLCSRRSRWHCVYMREKRDWDVFLSVRNAALDACGR